MKIYWKHGALNFRPETEEDGAITTIAYPIFISAGAEV